MNPYEISPSLLTGKIKVPPSKSDAQRAILIAALANGNSRIHNIGYSDDVKVALNAIEKLGAKVSLNDAYVDIFGITKSPEKTVLNLHESGLSSRMLGSIVSLFDTSIRLEASGSLKQRPMSFFDETLSKFGVEVHSSNGYFPVSIKGPLKHGEVHFDSSFSSQFLSGLLVALTQVLGTSKLLVSNLTSKPYIDMTLDTLQAFGVSIQHKQYHEFTITGKQQLNPIEYHVEGDWSASSYWFIAAALGQDIKIQSLNPQSFQADKKIIDVLREANCEVFELDGDYRVDGTNKKAFETDLTDCPDLFPAVAVFAGLCNGKSILHGANRLTHKESNRAFAIQQELSKVGCKVEIIDNTLHIEGVNKPKASVFSSHNDHRMAMSLAILSLFCNGKSYIKHPEVVTKSYPDFWKDFETLKKGN